MFSGGVGEYVYGREPRDFGDLGKLFGEAVRARLDAGALPWPLLPAGECIRATVLGASEYSVQLSGNTTYVSEPRALLPRKNLQVVPLPHVFGETAVDAVGGRCAHCSRRSQRTTWWKANRTWRCHCAGAGRLPTRG